MTNKTSDTTYREFIEESRRMLSDALITGGLNAMGNKFEYSVLQWYYSIQGQGGFKPVDKK